MGKKGATERERTPPSYRYIKGEKGVAFLQESVNKGGWRKREKNFDKRQDLRPIAFGGLKSVRRTREKRGQNAERSPNRKGDFQKPHFKREPKKVGFRRRVPAVPLERNEEGPGSCLAANGAEVQKKRREEGKGKGTC